MSDDKQVQDNEFDYRSNNMVGPDGSDNADFDDLSEIEAAEKATKTSESDGNQRLWLYLGLAALLSAGLVRLIISPVLDNQKQRLDRVSDILQQFNLTNTSASQSLTEIGSIEPVKNNLDALSNNISKMVSPQSLAGKATNRLFGNVTANAKLSATMDSYRESANNFIAQGDEVAAVKNNLAVISNAITSTVSDTVSFVKVVAQEGSNRRDSKTKDRYLVLTSEAANINGMLSRLAGGVRDYYLPNVNLKQHSAVQGTLVIRLKNKLSEITGNATKAVTVAAAPLQAKFDGIGKQIVVLGNNATAITQSRLALQQMLGQTENFNAWAIVSGNQLDTVSLFDMLNDFLPVLLVALGIYALSRFFNLQNRDLVKSEGSLSDALADQQESILKLLDEMSALADGDLTVEAEVTDQITGAIADSVNFAVIEMRELVSQINRASLQVADESELAVSNAQSVSQSNRHQAEKITVAAADMQRVTNSMREMSEQAQNSSEMAGESIQAATQGAQAVRDTIEGMNDMREQIQDTSKRIKRLGESSQRIGDIVALIDDIAEQTNILSLNAAIQASMAGEAGRGFAVVSDEVQSLAERSTEATKKIAELVNTIQNDTNDAVRSMEKATQQVVNGTKVADSAGSALAEIESVSGRLSTLIKAISERCRQQAQVVTEVAEKVTIVSDSSTETSRKAQDSANSIAKLLALAKELEASVLRFKLPQSS